MLPTRFLPPQTRRIWFLWEQPQQEKPAQQNTLPFCHDKPTACQAIDIRRRLNTHGQGISPVHQKVFDRVRKDAAFYETDRELWQDIKAVEQLVRNGELLSIVAQTVPDFE